MTTKFEFDESWISPATLKAWPFSTIEIDRASTEYLLLTPKRGHSEQDPKEWFRAAKEVMAAIFETTPDAKVNLEGITFSLKDSYEVMKKHSSKEFSQIVSVGSGAKKPDWLQMQAEIFNAPVVTLETEQGPAMGAAMIAAVGAGWFSDFEACSKEFVKYESEVKPNPEAVSQYEKAYANYQEVYPTIKDLSHKLVTDND